MIRLGARIVVFAGLLCGTLYADQNSQNLTQTLAKPDSLILERSDQVTADCLTIPQASAKALKSEKQKSPIEINVSIEQENEIDLPYCFFPPHLSVPVTNSQQELCPFPETQSSSQCSAVMSVASCVPLGSD